MWKSFKNIYNYSGGSNDGTMILYDGMPHIISSMGNTTTGYIDVNLYPGTSSQKAAYTDVKIHKEFRLADGGPLVRNWLTAPTVGQGSSYTYDNNYLLSSCPNLTSVDIADGFNYIPTRYFYNSSKLKTVKIGRMSRNYGTPPYSRSASMAALISRV